MFDYGSAFHGVGLADRAAARRFALTAGFRDPAGNFLMTPERN
ncbi:hypothetical protein [Arthrobacter pullicola]|nr:hypothetical protein [Arthrobacter pullicola]